MPRRQGDGSFVLIKRNSIAKAGQKNRPLVFGTCTVTKGVKYVLEVEATVEGKNGTDEIFEETSNICP